MHFVGEKYVWYILVIATVKSTKSEKYKDIYENSLECSKETFPCVPRLQAVLLSDIVGRDDSLEQMILIHRCEPHSGCCDGQKICQPTEKGLQYFCLHYYSTELSKTEDQLRKIAVLVNHTKCECGAKNWVPPKAPSCEEVCDVKYETC